MRGPSPSHLQEQDVKYVPAAPKFRAAGVENRPCHAYISRLTSGCCSLSPSARVCVRGVTNTFRHLRSPGCPRLLGFDFEKTPHPRGTDYLDYVFICWNIRSTFTRVEMTCNVSEHSQ